jgi:nuclear transport factor 2 (NTF2) superfamily protein
MSRSPRPPFRGKAAAQKVRMAEDAWNSRGPARVALGNTDDSPVAQSFNLCDWSRQNFCRPDR